ncbi:hypothetical protein NMY22_g5564 [Coprinellus aureogranulatus]|nr:hypothetical protein NMY22_g5564 [Coprinellus aureogranulatus]
MCRLPPELIPGICNGMEDKDLFSMALSSRSLLNPALDVLWEAVYSFRPLICCLPDDLLDFKGTSPDYVRLRRTMCAQDLERYLTTYAPRIRSVRLGLRFQKLFLSPEVLDGLHDASQFVPGALSPNATYLHWIPSIFQYDPDGTHINLFAGDKLAGLRVRAVRLRQTHRATFVSVIERISRGLVRLKLDAPSTDPPFIEKLMLCHPWDDLADLEIYSISHNTFRKIAHLPQLNKLHLHTLERIPLRYGIHEPPTYPPSTFFPSLKALAIQTNRLLPVVSAVQHLNPASQLQSLTVMVHGDGTDPASFEEVEAFFGIIGHHCNPSTFTSLWVSISKSREEPLDGNAVNIVPLFSLPHLDQIHITSYFPLHFSPADVAMMIASLPKLRTLAIIGNKYANSPPSLGFEHIWQLAQGLPELRDLKLRFDATRIRGDEKGPGAPYPNIEILDVLTSPTSSPCGTIRWLQTNFPNLRRLDHAICSEDEGSQCFNRERRWVVTKCWLWRT